ncbi:YbaB/EbfC family nucleoid-associated protein [Catellatospora tritici]|uniref:YbaB/EbfC family nucleoid-associated protein n=1 Tax=Catellatospora tritici TaxID=2851566 RepID=UPI0027E0749A|nr:YbaB/EbfC family nucleoid-associated protein [Catellatospora tritici]
MRFADRHANDDLMARFDEVYDRYTKLRGGLGTLQARLKDLHGTAATRDRLVQVKVGPQGQLVELVIHDDAYRRYPARELGSVITGLTQTAAAQAAEQMQQLLGEFMPPDTGAAEFVRTGDFGSLLRRADAAAEQAAEEHSG